MKKSILAITALSLMLASCSQDETIEVTTREAITFGNAFIENSTRAVDNSYNNEGFSAPFHVYGTITNKNGETANLFNQELVEKKNGSWVYNEAHTQYWIPGNTYNFTAIVDGNDNKGASKVETDKNGMPASIKLTDASKQLDILYAKSEERKYQLGDPAKKVEFTFEHLMAKAVVSVINDIKIDNGYSYKVREICMSAQKSASYAVEKGYWTGHKDEYTLEFGDITDNPIHTAGSDGASFIGFQDKKESAFARLLIPSGKDKKTKISLKFKFELYKDKVLVESGIKDAHAEVQIEKGCAYNFQITLGEPGDPIKFSVAAVNGWGEDNKVETQGTNK